MLGYAIGKGSTLLDRRLYLPEDWVEAAEFAERRQKCGVPEDIAFKAKQELSWEMIQSQAAAKALRGKLISLDFALTIF